MILYAPETFLNLSLLYCILIKNSSVHVGAKALCLTLVGAKEPLKRIIFANLVGVKDPCFFNVQSILIGAKEPLKLCLVGSSEPVYLNLVEAKDPCYFTLHVMLIGAKESLKLNLVGTSEPVYRTLVGAKVPRSSIGAKKPLELDLVVGAKEPLKLNLVPCIWIPSLLLFFTCHAFLACYKYPVFSWGKRTLNFDLKVPLEICNGPLLHLPYNGSLSLT